MTNLQEKAMRMALEALDCLPWQASPIAIEATKALRQALAESANSTTNLVEFKTSFQPEQEPEWIDDDFGTMWQKCGKKDCGKFVVRVGKVDCWNGDCLEKEPKREWVGLTDEEIEEGADLSRLYRDQFEPVARWAEAKLKDKNNGNL